MTPSLGPLAVLQAISFFTSDTNYLFEGVYYAPLVFLCGSLLLFCSIASYVMLGPVSLIATVFYLLITLLIVRPAVPQSARAMEWGCLRVDTLPRRVLDGGGGGGGALAA